MQSLDCCPEVFFYSDPTPLFSSPAQSKEPSTQEAFAEAKERIEETVVRCEQRARQLPISARQEYLGRVYKMAGDLIGELKRASATGLSGKQLLEKANQSLRNISDLPLHFMEDKQTFMRKRESVRHAHDVLVKDLTGLSLSSPPPPPTHTPSTEAPSTASPTWQKVSLMGFPPESDLTRCLDRQLGQIPYMKEKKIIDTVAAQFANTIASTEDVAEGVKQGLLLINQTLHLNTHALIATALSFERALPQCSVTLHLTPTPSQPSLPSSPQPERTQPQPRPQLQSHSHPSPQGIFKEVEEIQQQSMKGMLKQQGIKELPLVKAIKSAAHEPFAEQNPILQKVLSGGTYALMGKYIHMPVMAHVIAEPARVAEGRVNQFLTTASPQDYAYKAALVAKVFLKLAQMPEHAFHAIHDRLTNTASAVCDTARITDQTFADFAQRLEDLY